MKDGDGIKSISATVQDSPIPASSTTRKRRSRSTSLRIDLARSEIRQANQVKAWTFPILHDSWILSWKLMFCDKIIAKTNVLRQLPLPFPSSPTLSSIGRRRRTSLSTSTRSLGVRNSWEDEQFFHDPLYLYIRKPDRLPFKFSKSWFTSRILRHVKSSRY